MSEKPNLSNHFRINPIIFSDNLYCASQKKVVSTSEYSNYKGVKGINIKNIEDDRSICQMTRNANGLTNFEHHNSMIYIVHFANNAVIKLGEYSGAKGNAWGGVKRRSDFTEDKRQLGQSYLENPHHSIFELLDKINKSVTDQKTKDYIVEISYYFERINSKILSYENEVGVIN